MIALEEVATFDAELQTQRSKLTKQERIIDTRD